MTRSQTSQVLLFKSVIQYIFEKSPSSDSWKQIFHLIASSASKISGIPFDPSAIESPDKMKEFGEKCLIANPQAISCLVYADQISQ
ncbi:MAG: hypothetical protein KIH08_17055 [Candidatus Freyarchaeota archaeon]|nr:hypothetical protein [Candidatus Jordarchaeia archaeon]MBS7269739.1 hypothetical protein [Candidatus Jordarchaeia archaeon]MBS7280534.1 hypothetical protein [Candidatus Jordarchaeia archaeon]